MTSIRYVLSGLAALAAQPLLAQPVVLTDVRPVAGLVARVMQGIGEPVALIGPGTSPHDFALRPSDAARIAAADIVIWTGPTLAPQFGAALAAIAPDTPALALDAGNEAHNEAEHADGEEVHVAEVHEDPHAWLDPEVATDWTGAIAAALSGVDPGNSARYAKNAGEAVAEIRALESNLTARAAPLQALAFVVLHDAFGAFSRAFGLEPVGAFSDGEARQAGLATTATLLDDAQARGVRCIFAEPAFPGRLERFAALLPGVHTGTLDPLGASAEIGPDHYAQMMGAIFDALEACHKGQSQ